MKPTNDYADTGTYVQHKRLPMLPYSATFRNEWDETYTMFADGITDVHADARAWLKFMTTQWYRDAPDSWKLEKLQLIFDKNGEYIIA
jgi:hypothetical protein|tara:strand:+ start:6478 stop:6741 length:264 start_codon:yes stop_codon:yes gene_type:complete